MNIRGITVYGALVCLFTGLIAQATPINILNYAQKGKNYNTSTIVNTAALGVPTIALAKKAFTYATAKQQKQPQKIRFKCCDGSVEVWPAVAKEFGFVRDTLKDDIVSLEADKAAEFDITIFGEYAPSKESLQLLLACIENPTLIATLSIKQIDSLLSIIPVLCPSKDICNAIIARENYLQSSSDIPDYIVSLKQILLKQIKNVAKEDKVILDLKNKGLASLNGLSQVASDDVWAINLSNNKLLSLDLAEIRKYFPNLRFVVARNNKIKKLTASDIAASKGLVVDLDSNEIATIGKATIFNDAPENGIIILNNNPLSKQAQKNIELFLTPSAWQKIKGTLSSTCATAAQRIQTLNTFLGMVPVSVNEISVSFPPGIIAWGAYKLEQMMKKSIIDGYSRELLNCSSSEFTKVDLIKAAIAYTERRFPVLNNVIPTYSLPAGLIIRTSLYLYGKKDTVLNYLGPLLFSIGSSIIITSSAAIIPEAGNHFIEYFKDKPDMTKYYLLLAALPTALSACSYAFKNLNEFKPTTLHMAQTKSPQKPKKTTSFADLD